MKKLIGGQALRELGSTRHTEDKDYLIFDENDSRLFINGTDDLINCANHKFYKEIWENTQESVSPEMLLEMAAFTFVQHCQNFNFEKADTKEFDIKFLVRTIGFHYELKIANKFMGKGELEEVNKVINSVKF